MNMSDIKKKNNEDLRKELQSKHETLREARFDRHGSKLRKAGEAKAVRKDVARIKTELRARELAA